MSPSRRFARTGIYLPGAAAALGTEIWLPHRRTT
jgi:hypothetical protein